MSDDTVPTIFELDEENTQLRRLLALTYCGVPLLYTDDGEMQDNREQPWIDFKRDSPRTIEHKMVQRGLALLSVQVDEGRDAEGGGRAAGEA